MPDHDLHAEFISVRHLLQMIMP